MNCRASRAVAGPLASPYAASNGLGARRLLSGLSEAGIGSLIGFELLPVVGSDPVARLAEMTAHVAAELPAELTVSVPSVDD